MQSLQTWLIIPNMVLMQLTAQIQTERILTIFWHNNITAYDGQTQTDGRQNRQNCCIIIMCSIYELMWIAIKMTLYRYQQNKTNMFFFFLSLLDWSTVSACSNAASLGSAASIKQVWWRLHWQVALNNSSQTSETRHKQHRLQQLNTDSEHLQHSQRDKLSDGQNCNIYWTDAMHKAGPMPGADPGG